MPLALTHDGSAVDLAAARVELGSLVQSFRAPWSLTVRRAIAFDEPTDWQNEDALELSRDGTVVFCGRIKSSERIASATGEHIVYTCIGLRGQADGVPFQRPVDGAPTARVVYNCPPEEELEEAGHVALPGPPSTVGEIVADILDAAAAELAGIIGDGTPGSGYEAAEVEALDAVPPKVVLSGMSVDEALGEVLRHAPDFGFYVDPATRRARFVDFRELVPHEVPGVGEAVLRHELDFSTAGCYSACTVQGGHEVMDVLETLTPAWDPELEADWDSEKAAQQPDTYGQVWRLFAASAPAAEGGAIVPERFVGSGDIIAMVTFQQTLTTRTFTASAQPAGESTLLLGLNARVWSNEQQKYVPALVRARFAYRRGRVSGRYPATGHTGTAHSRRGLVRELVLLDEERGRKVVRGRVDAVLSPTTFESHYEFLRHDQVAGLPIEFNGDGVEHTIAENGRGCIVLAEEPATPLQAGDTYEITVQDDTRKEFEGGTLSILEKYAKETLERVMDERFVGSVPLAGLDWTLALGQKIHFTGTGDPEYAALGATLVAVEHDLGRERTVLSLTSDRAFGGTLTWDELERQRRRDRQASENAVQIRRLWRHVRNRRSPEGGAASGDPHQQPDDGGADDYTADETWLHREERQFQHIGPAAVARAVGGAGQFIEWIQLDARGHVVDAGAGTFS